MFDSDEPVRISLPTKRDLSNIEVRKLIPARDDLKPLYVNSQGFRVGKSSDVVQIHDRDKKVSEVRMNDISQINIFGNIQISTQAIQSLCAAEIPISYFSMGGWFYGVTQGIGIKNIFLRREQFRHADREKFCLSLARQLVSGKIRNQRTMLLRNHVEPPRRALDLLKEYQDDAERAASLPQLLGIEGNSARLYFENFPGLLKVDRDEDLTPEHSVMVDCDTTDCGTPLRVVNHVADQGAQFTSHDFTSLLMENQIAISMDGRGRALDNVFIERLWRSVKYEDIYLKDYESGADLYCGLERYFDFYDHRRIHQALDYRTPHEVFAASLRTTSGRQTQRSKQPRPTLT